MLDHPAQGTPGPTHTISDSGFDPTITYVSFRDWPDLNAMAARVDFGTVRIEPEVRTVLIDADPAKVDAIVKAFVPPKWMAIPPAPGANAAAPPQQIARLPKALSPSDRVKAGYRKHDDDWRAAAVVRRDRGQYKIHFNDQPTTDDQWVDGSALRPADPAK